MWTLALTLTGVIGLWLVATNWYGWLVYLLNEVIWLAYGLTIHSTPVLVMSVIWFALGVRNLYVARKAYLRQLRSDLPDAPHAGGVAAHYLQHVCLWYDDVGWTYDGPLPFSPESRPR